MDVNKNIRTKNIKTKEKEPSSIPTELSGIEDFELEQDERRTPTPDEADVIEQLREQVYCNHSYSDEELHLLVTLMAEQRVTLKRIQREFENAQGSSSIKDDPKSIYDRILRYS